MKEDKTLKFFIEFYYRTIGDKELDKTIVDKIIKGIETEFNMSIDEELEKILTETLEERKNKK